MAGLSDLLAQQETLAVLSDQLAQAGLAALSGLQDLEVLTQILSWAGK